MLPVEIFSFSPVTIVITAVTLIVAVVSFVFLQRKGLPPGPTGLPFLGYWPFINNQNVHLKLGNLKKKYGDVSSVSITGHLYINLCSHAAVREAQVTKADCFNSRIIDYNLLQDMFQNGVLFLNGETWKVQRKFFLQVMKERGVKAITASLSGSLYEIVNDTIGEMKTREGKDINITELLTRKCITTLRLTLFGEEGLSEDEIRPILREYEVMTVAMSPINFLLVGKIARYCIFPFKPEYRASMKAKKNMLQLLREVVEKHKRTFDEHHIRDVIDDFIKERNERQKKGDPTAKMFSDEALLGSLVQFIGDGILSTSFLVSIMTMSLVKHPEEQDKIYKEMIEVVGHDRLPVFEDKPKLPYLNAFMLEVLRMSDLFAIFPTLQCTKETTLQGYRIPKGSIALMNMYSCHYDPEIYEQPEKFNPSRFIVKEGKRRPELPLTFGVGKRNCLGEAFAMTQLFLFMSAIIKTFRLTLPKSVDAAILFELVTEQKLIVRATPRKSK